jgi:hypothetical protein
MMRDTRRAFLTVAFGGGFLAACAAVAAALPAEDPTTRTTASDAKAECPADWDRGSRECKKARAIRKCPELKGGKCLAKHGSSTAATAPKAD